MRNAAKEEEQKVALLSGVAGALSGGEMETAAGGKRLAGSQRKTQKWKERVKRREERERESVCVGEGGMIKFHNEQILCPLEA